MTIYTKIYQNPRNYGNIVGIIYYITIIPTVLVYVYMMSCRIYSINRGILHPDGFATNKVRSEGAIILKFKKSMPPHTGTRLLRNPRICLWGIMVI